MTTCTHIRMIKSEVERELEKQAIKKDHERLSSVVSLELGKAFKKGLSDSYADGYFAGLSKAQKIINQEDA